MNSKANENDEKDEISSDEVSEQMLVLDEIVDSLSKTISDLKSVKELESHNLLTEILVRLPDGGIDFREATKSFETNLIKKALNASHGNQTKAAKLLRMNLTTLNAAIKRLGIEYRP